MLNVTAGGEECRPSSAAETGDAAREEHARDDTTGAQAGCDDDGAEDVEEEEENDDDDDDDEEDPAADVDDGAAVAHESEDAGDDGATTTVNDRRASNRFPRGRLFVERWIDETDDESEPSLFSIRGDLESCVEERRTTLRGSDAFRLSKATWAQN